MTDLNQQIARLEKLDTDRPKIHYAEKMRVQQLDFLQHGTRFAITFDSEDAYNSDIFLHLDFFLAAPEMMTVIREQQRLLGLAVEALAYYAKPSDYKQPFASSKLFYDCGSLAKKTLALLEPTEEV